MSKSFLWKFHSQICVGWMESLKREKRSERKESWYDNGCCCCCCCCRCAFLRKRTTKDTLKCKMAESMACQVGKNIHDPNPSFKLGSGFTPNARVTSWSQLHQHFTSTFCTNILAPKNYKAKLQAQKVFGARILAQKLLVKCWWNWHLVMF